MAGVRTGLEHLRPNSAKRSHRHLTKGYVFHLFLFLIPEGIFRLHPGRLTSNIHITHLERKMIFQTPMMMFHVNLPGCTRITPADGFCLPLFCFFFFQDLIDLWGTTALGKRELSLWKSVASANPRIQSLDDGSSVNGERMWRLTLQGSNISHFFHIVGDSHQPNNRPIIRIPY